MTMETVDEVLAHYGVRGMKWGVRKSRKAGKTSPEPSGPEPVLIKTKPGNYPIKTTGGKGHPASDDAISSAAARQKARSSGPHSLSNQEMKLVIDRMNLEQQYAKLNPRQMGRGERLIKGFLRSPAPDLALNITKGKFKDAIDPKHAAFNAIIAQRVMIGEQILKAAKKVG